MRKQKSLFVVAIFVIFFLFTCPQKCFAPSSASTLTSTVTAVSSCTVTATTLAFGAVVPGGSTVTQTNTITPTCTNSTPWTIYLNAGSGTFTNRTMTSLSNPGTPINYNIYTTSAHTTIWGDTTGGTVDVGGTGSGAAQPQIGYGQILNPLATLKPAADYTDTITATVNY